MTKPFALTPELTCPELDGYKLPEIESGLQKARKILSDGIKSNMSLSSAIAELDKLIREERPPIAIEVDMVEVRSKSFRTVGCSWFTEVGCVKDVCTCYDLVPATHPDGTVKGVWVYSFNKL
jgi:hypothetical protein